MDVFEDSLCKDNPHKAECFEVFDDNESNFHEWFFRTDRPDFMEHICFKALKECSRALLDEDRRKEEALAVEASKPKKSVETSDVKDQPTNQIVMNPDAELRAAHPEIFENLQKHHGGTTAKEPCKQCIFQSPKDLIAPLLVSIMIAIGFAAWYIVLENRKMDKEAKEPLQRSKRRTSIKDL
jgi:hypothetical protein